MEAFITLATNDSYCLGACTLAYSLRRSGTTRQLAVMITSSVSEDMRKVLAKVFDHVEMVELMHSGDPAGLKLMDRQDLGGTFTKLHCWKMTQYSKAVFMDADTLVLRNIDDIFEREEFSAAPDPGWPDCFNSGVFVFRPSVETYGKLLDFATEHGSFDGADQGLLNRYFSDWATKDISRHLPFLYNCSMWEFYSYLPALREFRPQVRVVHFIGPVKPWHQSVHDTGDSDERSVYKNDFLRQWWGAFTAGVQPLISSELESHDEGMMKEESVGHKALPASTWDSTTRVALKFPEPFSEMTRPFYPLPSMVEAERPPDMEVERLPDMYIPAVPKKTSSCPPSKLFSGESTPHLSSVSTLSPASEPSPGHAEAMKKAMGDFGAMSLEAKYEESHRAAWDHGHIDYLGVDRFDNILAKLNESLKDKVDGRHSDVTTPRAEIKVEKKSKKSLRRKPPKWRVESHPKSPSKKTDKSSEVRKDAAKKSDKSLEDRKVVAKKTDQSSEDRKDVAKKTDKSSEDRQLDGEISALTWAKK